MNDFENDLQTKGWIKDASGNWSHPSRRRLNDDCGKAQGAVVERAVPNASLESLQGETCYTERVLVRIHSFRRRAIDPDNGTIKWMVDSLRYLQIIGNDKPEDIEVGFSQTKVSSEEEERTVITITPL